MGIKGLAKLLSDEAPNSIREVELKSLHGRKIAIDASMAIYQFLIAVRSAGGGGGFGGAPGGGAASMLTNADGDTTSHIQGMLTRTIRYMTEGIKPIYVFDGKPPQVKSDELSKRREKREKAQDALKVANETGDTAEMDKQSKRIVRAGHKENDDCKRLLRLMGIPIVEAPCEAEAQCATLAKAGVVYATSTEDMDALTFQTPMLLRKMSTATAGNSGKGTLVQSINYKAVIDGLNINHEQFVDLCIMLGCDYCDTIRGVGPKTALKLIRQHNNIETILTKIDKKKLIPPDNWLKPSERQKQKSIDGEKKKKNTAHSPSDKIKNVEKRDGVDELDTSSSRDEEEDDVDPVRSTIPKTTEAGETKTPASISPISGDEKQHQKQEDEGENDIGIKDNDDNNIDEENDDETFIPAYVQARRLFNEHEVHDAKSLIIKWKPCDVDGLKKFLIDEMGFNVERTENNIKKLQTAYKANLKPQTRMDSFFKAKPMDPTIAADKNKKRKAEATATAAKNKKQQATTKGKKGKK